MCFDFTSHADIEYARSFSCFPCCFKDKPWIWCLSLNPNPLSQDFIQNLNSLFPYVDTSADIIKIGEISTNILYFSESALNSLKTSDIVQKILDLKGKVVVDTDLHKLSDQIHKLTEAIDRISLENRKLTSELVITKNVNSRLEERIINLEKIRRKGSSIAEGIM